MSAPLYKPLIDTNLNEFDETGWQTRFALSPFGNSETREERIKRWEDMGVLDPDCTACKEFYNHPTLSAFAPSHKPNPHCRSGGRPHCTCDGCF